MEAISSVANSAPDDDVYDLQLEGHNFQDPQVFSFVMFIFNGF
jgi:hypothetical protein